MELMLPREVLPRAARESPEPRDSDEFPGRADKKPPHKRRPRRRKWKPYSKLTWDERKELDERDSVRAHRVRDEMSSCGLTLAPYNTNQFLMEDHNLQEPDYEHLAPNGHRHRTNGDSVGSSDEYYSSPEDEEDFLQRQFIETYEDVHVERLNSMSKVELVQELMCLEDKVEGLEKSLLRERLESLETESGPQDLQELEAQLEKIRVYREEIQKLARENDGLKRENERLRSTCEGESDFFGL